MLKKGRLFFW
jgi:hypothetical protein